MIGRIRYWLIKVIVDGENREFIKRRFGLNDKELTEFIDKNSEEILFRKLKNEMGNR